MLPLTGRALRGAMLASSLLALVALAGGGVRILPLLVDPTVPWPVVLPFARGVASIGFEAALVVGWPLGWALGVQGAVARGEGQVLQLLGERPLRTTLRLVPQALLLAVAVAVASLAWGRDAMEPGRVVGELLGHAHDACAEVRRPMATVVPLVGLTWLCVPGRPPRVLTRGPAALRGAVVVAENVHIAPDLRRVELERAHVRWGTSEVHAATLVVRGLDPWTKGANLPSWNRALVLVFAALVSGLVAARATLTGPRDGRVRAVLLGVVGPLVALGLLRALERSEAHVPTFAAVPLAALVATALLGLVLARLRRRC